jgi:hypothetical protein
MPGLGGKFTFDLSTGRPSGKTQDSFKKWMAKRSSNAINSKLEESALVAASMAPKSRSCINTTYPFDRVHNNIFRSGALGGPVSDQWTQS